MTKATERMNTGDGGLAKHSAVCEQQIKWEEARIVGRETRMTQRKYLEGIESLKEKGKGVINSNRGNPSFSSTWRPEGKKHCVCHICGTCIMGLTHTPVVVFTVFVVIIMYFIFRIVQEDDTHTMLCRNFDN